MGEIGFAGSNITDLGWRCWYDHDEVNGILKIDTAALEVCLIGTITSPSRQSIRAYRFLMSCDGK